MISTFNLWFIVAPSILLAAVLFSVLSVTEENGKAKKRCSDRIWNYGIAAYSVAAWWILTKLLVAESLLGMIEYTKSDDPYARNVFSVLAGLWAAVAYVVAMVVRGQRFKHISLDCKHGRSKEDVSRRKRRGRSDRRQERLDRKRKRMIKSGKIYVLEPKTNTAGPNAEQQRAIDYRVNQLLEHYDIQERDNLDCFCNDDSGKHSITKYVPKGVYKYFVAVNLEDESEDPIFLGCDDRKTAEDNLKRYLTERIEKKILAKAMNQ